MDNYYYKITRIQDIIKKNSKVESFIFTITLFSYTSEVSELMVSNSYIKVKIYLNKWNIFEFLNNDGSGLIMQQFRHLNGLFCSDTKEGEYYEAFNFLSYLYDILEEYNDLEYEQIEKIHKDFKNAINK